jgi:hypothetical protein
MGFVDARENALPSIVHPIAAIAENVNIVDD